LKQENIAIAGLAILLLAACAAALFFSDAYSKRTEAFEEVKTQLAESKDNATALLQEVAGQKILVLSLNADKAKLYQDKAFLEQRLAERQATILELNSTISGQDEKISALAGSINKTREELVLFERSLNESSAWFKLNSNIQNFSEYRKYFFQLEFSCIQLSGDYCYVKLACLPVVNDIYSDFSYKTDEDTSKKGDKLQSLSEFYINKGGDCEDYSLAAKAEINYLISLAKTRGCNTVRFEAAETAGEGNVYAVDVPQTWGYKNAKAFLFPVEYTDPFVLCGTFPIDLNAQSGQYALGGHCLLAFSKIAPATSEKLHDAISDAILVEPQTGFYYTSTKNDTVFYKPANGEKISKATLYSKPSFWAAITDDDYYLYTEQDGGLSRWQGYKDLYEKTEQSIAQLVATNN